MIGKWHLGYYSPNLPLDRGFDRFYGFLGGSYPYFGSTIEPMYDQDQPFFTTDYLTESFTREAVNFIEEERGSPFFLEVAFNAAHEVLAAPQHYLDRFPNLSGKRQLYAAVVSAMDDGVGEIQNALERNNLRANTLVIFISDNGAVAQGTGAGSNYPLRGSKDQVYEGGLRVPFILSWPARLPQSSVYSPQSCSLDIVPTCMMAANAQLTSDDPHDGVSLIPYVRGDRRGVPHRSLWWRMGVNRAIRYDNWKWLETNRTAKQVLKSFLFDMAVDPYETTDVQSTKPELVSDLKRRWSNWAEKLAPPKW